MVVRYRLHLPAGKVPSVHFPHGCCGLAGVGIHGEHSDCNHRAAGSSLLVNVELGTRDADADSGGAVFVDEPHHTPLDVAEKRAPCTHCLCVSMCVCVWVKIIITVVSRSRVKGTTMTWLDFSQAVDASVFGATTLTTALASQRTTKTRWTRRARACPHRTIRGKNLEQLKTTPAKVRHRITRAIPVHRWHTCSTEPHVLASSKISAFISSSSASSGPSMFCHTQPTKKSTKACSKADR